jgi:hypothetical protein
LVKTEAVSKKSGIYFYEQCGRNLLIKIYNSLTTNARGPSDNSLTDKRPLNAPIT